LEIFMTKTEKLPESKTTEHSDELLLLKSFLDNYGKPVFTALIAVVILVGGFRFYQRRSNAQAAEAELRLASARTMTDLESVVADCAKTDVAPRALLALAKLYFDNGSFEIALSKYDQFIMDYPEYPLVEGAVLGRLLCIEARGDRDSLEEATMGFDSFVQDNPSHYLSPQAAFGKARCLIAMDAPDEAKAIYQSIINDRPDTIWAYRAEELTDVLVRDAKRPEKTPPSAESAKSDPVIAMPDAAADLSL